MLICLIAVERLSSTLHNYYYFVVMYVIIHLFLHSRHHMRNVSHVKSMLSYTRLVRCQKLINLIVFAFFVDAEKDQNVYAS